VHSDRDVGFEYAKIIGRSFTRDIVSTTRSSKAPPTVESPMIPVGRSVSIAVTKSAMGAWPCANGRW
jgi:hypothetical protein